MKVIGVIFVIFTIISKICGIDEEKTSLFCMDVNPQRNVDIDQIMGMWYGSEIITHSQNDPSGTHFYDSCVVIHLADITNQLSTTTERQRDYKSYSRTPLYEGYHRYLKLVWEENGVNLEYTLKYNSTRAGFWLSLGPQRGTMLDLPYQQFSGTIQVVKAVQDHVVLTFCHKVLNTNLFSIILSREPNSLTFDDYRSIHSMLRRRGLTTNTIRKVCTPGSSNGNQLTGTVGLITLITMLILNYKIYY